MAVTLSFNAKMDLADFECNLKDSDSQKWPREGDLFFMGTQSERTLETIAKAQPILTGR